MTLAVRGVFWVLAYLGVCIAPLVFAAIGASEPGHGFWTNFSVALAFVGLAMMGLEFALVARYKSVAAPFGQDGLLQALALSTAPSRPSRNRPSSSSRKYS